MAKRLRGKDERMFQLAETRDAGTAVKALIETEALKVWFAEAQKQLVSQVTAASGGDTELLRIAGLRLQIFLQFKSALSVAAGEAVAASKQLERLTHE